MTYRSSRTGRQYNVHNAVAAQTCLGPDTSMPLERVSPAELRKVLVADDLNGPARWSAPLQRFVAPPGALQAVPSARPRRRPSCALLVDIRRP